MYKNFVPLREAVTPDSILDVLRDAHRQQCQLDPEADPDAVFPFVTTVAEWRQACDILAWRQIAHVYESWWEIHCSEEEWHASLEPPDQRTLRDICNLLASYAKLPRTHPAVLLGYPCLSGGMFLTIRSLLCEGGADAAQITTSMPLDSYTRRYLNVFLGPISWLAPGAMPLVKIHDPKIECQNYLL